MVLGLPRSLPCSLNTHVLALSHILTKEFVRAQVLGPLSRMLASICSGVSMGRLFSTGFPTQENSFAI